MTDFVDKKWNEQHDKLVEFKRRNGHCRVPHQHKEDKSLGHWVCTQRNHHKNNKLRLDRKKRLDEIGFVWKPDGPHHNIDKLWRQHYEKLVEFKRNKGHCMVPMSHKLGQWVSTQRKYQTNDEILQDRKDLLDKLGFVWRVDRSALIWKADDELYHSKWKKQYEKLVEFQQKNGHCLVPRKNKDGTSLGSWVLGSWVKYQRTRHAVGKMQPEEVDLLDKLKFDWKADTLAARSSTTTDNSDTEAFTNSVGLAEEAKEDTEPAQGHVTRI